MQHTHCYHDMPMNSVLCDILPEDIVLHIASYNLVLNGNVPRHITVNYYSGNMVEIQTCHPYCRQCRKHSIDCYIRCHSVSSTLTPHIHLDYYVNGMNVYYRDVMRSKPRQLQILESRHASLLQDLAHQSLSTHTSKTQINKCKKSIYNLEQKIQSVEAQISKYDDKIKLYEHTLVKTVNTTVDAAACWLVWDYDILIDAIDMPKQELQRRCDAFNMSHEHIKTVLYLVKQVRIAGTPLKRNGRRYCIADQQLMDEIICHGWDVYVAVMNYMKIDYDLLHRYDTDAHLEDWKCDKSYIVDRDHSNYITVQKLLSNSITRKARTIAHTTDAEAYHTRRLKMIVDKMHNPDDIIDMLRC